MVQIFFLYINSNAQVPFGQSLCSVNNYRPVADMDQPAAISSPAVDEMTIIELHLISGMRVFPVPVVPSAEVAEWQTRYVQGVVSITGRESSNLSFGTTNFVRL